MGVVDNLGNMDTVFHTKGGAGRGHPSRLRSRILKEASARPKQRSTRRGHPWTKNPVPYTAAWDYSQPNDIKQVPIAPYKDYNQPVWNISPEAEQDSFLSSDSEPNGVFSQSLDPVAEELDALHQEAVRSPQAQLFNDIPAASKASETSSANTSQGCSQSFSRLWNLHRRHTKRTPSDLTSSSESMDEETKILIQPETRPISQEQLVNEVKGIYAGLVMVEKKCVEICKQQAETNNKLSNEQWQALIALHRTLLHEHHDFLLASQHPSASPALRNLAHKYRMPERMWRHSVHAFLELLRHRLPHEIDRMLSFVFLAYEMIAKLQESLPEFASYWQECLEDLGDYAAFLKDPNQWNDSGPHVVPRKNRCLWLAHRIAALGQTRGCDREPPRRKQYRPGLFSPPNEDMWVLAGWYHLGMRFARSLKTYSTVFKVLTLHILL